jgi:hypothetical protein
MNIIVVLLATTAMVAGCTAAGVADRLASNKVANADTYSREEPGNSETVAAQNQCQTSPDVAMSWLSAFAHHRLEQLDEQTGDNIVIDTELLPGRTDALCDNTGSERMIVSVRERDEKVRALTCLLQDTTWRYQLREALSGTADVWNVKEGNEDRIPDVIKLTEGQEVVAFSYYNDGVTSEGGLVIDCNIVVAYWRTWLFEH